MRFLFASWLLLLGCGAPEGAPDAAGAEDGGVTSDSGNSRDAAPPPPPPPPTSGWCEGDETALGRALAGVGAGEWAELAVDESLGALMLHDHLTSWSDTGVYDPVHRTVQWVGSPGSCCADPSAYQLLIYDIASDTWRAEETPWPDDTGHAYDGSAIDPERGVHYFARSSSVAGWDGSGWTALPSPGPQPIAVGLTWFRSTSSLVLVGREVSVFDGTEWAVLDDPDASFAGYHQFAEYDPVHDVAWLGAGNGNETRSAVLRADGSVEPLADAPLSLNGDGRSMKTYDPVTGDFVVQDGETDRWWTFDITTDTWTEMTEAVRAARPETWSVDAKDFVVPIDDCGALLYFQWVHWNEHRVFLYRHASPT